jgi:pyrimidine operon attenuation protein/uracil phosphoribosyltransferase
MPMSKTLADSQQLQKAVEEIAEKILSIVKDPSRLALIGIHTHGVPLAQRLKKYIDNKTCVEILFGTLDITLYRDDYDLRGVKPRIRSSDIRFSVDELELILVDDVLFTGRTIRAAIEALGDYGRPSAIRLAVLADRGHRELPIQPDAVGFTFKTQKTDLIKLKMTELDGTDAILLHEGGVKD